MTNTSSTNPKSTATRRKRIRLLAAAGAGAAVIIVGGATAGGSNAQRPASTPEQAAAATAHTPAETVDQAAIAESANQDCLGGRVELPDADRSWDRAPLRVYGDNYDVAIPDGWSLDDRGSVVASTFVLEPIDYTDVVVTVGSLPPGFGRAAVDLFLEDYLVDAGLSVRLSTAEQVSFAGHAGCRLTGSVDGRYVEVVYSVTGYGELLIAGISAAADVDPYYVANGRAILGSIQAAA